MEISIPETIEFYTQESRNKMWHWKYYCFPHAVLRALEGEQIRTKLVAADVILRCEDCNNFGVPQSHDLGRLRRLHD